MERTDILHTDVFFSWTGVDRELKNIIVDYLRKHNITCTESDYACSGNFEQWSVEAVSKSSIFLLLYTKDTPQSRYVPDEIHALQQLEDHTNRCVPVVTDFDLFRKNLPELGSCISAVILEDNYPNEAELDKILHNIRQLLCNQMYAMYRQATVPAYLRFVSMLRGLRLTEELDHEKLYIDRTVTDEAGKAESDAAVFCKTKDIIYLHGPAGSGKTCYIDQLRNAADASTLVLALPCRDLAQTQDLFAAMYEEFCEYIGSRDFYTPAAFRSLLSAKHLLLVLDGLDEIGTQAGKDGLLRLVRTYYKANSERTTLFITSRSDDDADMWKMNGQTPQVWALNSLEDDQIRAFSSELFLLLGSPEKGDDFYIRLQDLEAEIRTNPLLISQLAIVYKVKNQLPQTIMGIYDAVCEITIDSERLRESAKADFDPGILRKLSAILKAFSTERYLLASAGKEKTAAQILGKILRDQGFDAEDAPLLLQFLHDRAILVGKDAFYHKMLQEYFTALYYYDRCFDLYGELENEENLRDLFTHCSDPYWSAVLQMFLVKADSCVDEDTTKLLYHQLMAYEITDFTLLFDVCKALARHKTAAQQALLTDLLSRSADGTYPPYGPLCWYVPEYELYAPLLSALEALQDQPCFTKALALTRDVCWLFGRHHTLKTVAPQIDGAALLEKATLCGIRKGLCELFFLGETQCPEGTDVYPRCFNLAEAKHWMAEGQGIFGRMGTPFHDELGLYTHEMLHPFGNEWVGIVSMPYDIPRIEDVLPSLSCKKLCGLFLSPGENTRMEQLAINDKHIRMLYIPENINVRSICSPISLSPMTALSGEAGILYFYSTLAIPGCFTTLQGYTFQKYHSSFSVSIPSSITTIDEDVFQNCNSLTSVIVEGSISQIGWNAFRGCRSLISILIQGDVWQIDGYAFQNCHALNTISVLGKIVQIGWFAFQGCTSLINISVSKGITSIAEGAFADCISLTGISFLEGVTTIGAYVFAGCNALKNIAVPVSVIQIKDCAFSRCNSLVSISFFSNITEIGSGAFAGCSSLLSLFFPDTLNKIGYGIFKGCYALTYISNCPTGYSREYLNLPESCVINYRQDLTDEHDPEKEIQEETHKTAYESVTWELLQPETIPYGATEIAAKAFEHCGSLTTIAIPSSVTAIGESAFNGCSSLVDISIPSSVTTIGNGAFSNCCSLIAITIPNSVEKIGNAVFNNCFSLNCIVLSSSITEVENSLFNNCSSLTSIVIPGGVTKIGNDAFNGCCSLVDLSIHNGVTMIGDGAFNGCCSIVDISIPDSVTTIGRSAFNGCSALVNISIPDGVVSIRERTFENCRSLISISVPRSVSVIGERTFYNCCSLLSVPLLDGITKIGASAFKKCSSLVSITIPNSITRIENETFFGCLSLESIKLPNSITKIEERVFSGCSALSSIEIPNSVTSIGFSAFKGCSSLTSITIPDGVTSIGEGAFSDCSSLTAITIGASVTSIGTSVFSGCNSLTSLTIGNDVTSIGDYAFKGCSSLTAITIGAGVTNIGIGAFEDCASLTSIVIPKAVRFIEDGAFKGCSGLREITISRRFEDKLEQIFPDVDLSEVKINWL